MKKTFEYKGSKISCSVVGEGQPVVLLHGFGEDSSIWKEQVDFLKEHYKVIVPDIPGTGSSDILQNNSTTIEDFATCIHELLKYEKIQNFVLLGHSMGGYITLSFAKLYPGQIKAFGLIHSTAFADTEEKKSMRQKGIRLIDENGAYPFLKNTIPNLFSKAFKSSNSDTVDALVEKGKGFRKEALIQYYSAMMNRTDTTEVLKKSEVPVLFIIGTEDTAAPLDDLLKQVHLPRISHILILEGVGHMSMLENKDELNKHLLHFLQSM